MSTFTQPPASPVGSDLTPSLPYALATHAPMYICTAGDHIPVVEALPLQPSCIDPSHSTCISAAAPYPTCEVPSTHYSRLHEVSTGVGNHFTGGLDIGYNNCNVQNCRLSPSNVYSSESSGSDCSRQTVKRAPMLRNNSAPGPVVINLSGYPEPRPSTPPLVIRAPNPTSEPHGSFASTQF